MANARMHCISYPHPPALPTRKPNRPASAHAYDKLTCPAHSSSLSHSRRRSLCMCCPFPSLSHPSSAAIRRPSSAPSPGPLLLACIASNPPHSKPMSLARPLHSSEDGMRALQHGRRLRHRRRSERRRRFARPGTSIRDRPPLHSHPPSRAAVSPFFPFGRPPEAQPIRASAQVPAGTRTPTAPVHGWASDAH